MHISTIPEAVRGTLPRFRGGEVALVGAGPGDPSLLTLRALHFMGNADVILHDRLVDSRILGLGAPQARREDIGKRAGQPSCSQALINRRLVNLARQGLRVLRLKGGDPLVFGRGGEELLTLAEAGIKCHIVPGVTAGIGGLAAAGIPLTHRGVNSGAVFLTGSDEKGALPAFDWDALALCGMPLVIYMGWRQRQSIARHLLAAGAPAMMPTAIVHAASTARQNVRELTLKELAEDREDSCRDPALLVIGDNVSLRSQFLQGAVPAAPWAAAASA